MQTFSEWKNNKGKPTSQAPVAGGVPSFSQWKSSKPVVEKKPTLGSKVVKVGKEIVKGIVSPVATIVARPIQLGAELAGATAEQVNKVNLGGLVAPVPQNMADVKKDVGRGIETVALGLPGAKLAQTVKAGAAFGVGSSLEQGNDLLSKETAKEVALGAGTGAVLHGAAKVIGKAFKVKKPPVVEKPIVSPETPPVVTQPAPIPETVPQPVVNKGQIPTDISKIVPEQPKIQSTPTPPEKVYEQVKVLDNTKPEDVQSGTHKLYVDSFNRDLQTNPQLVEDIAMGRVGHPEKIPADAYLSLLSNEAEKTGNIDLINKLSDSRVSSISGTKLEANKLKTKDNIVDIIRDIKQTKQEELVKRTGNKSEKEISNFSKQLKQALESVSSVKPTKQMVVEALEAIKCK